MAIYNQDISKRPTVSVTMTRLIVHSW